MQRSSCPEGILFGTNNAHVAIRKKLVEENRLDGVVSMPSGVFRPYTGVSTAVLLFTRAATTEKVWFYEMEHDGLSLDDKRQRVPENDIPDLVDSWAQRHDAEFQEKRRARLAELGSQVAPLEADRIHHQAAIQRLEFEEVMADRAAEAIAARQIAEAELAELEAAIQPLAREIDQLTRQFWVTKDDLKATNYDLFARRYRHAEARAAFHEDPAVTLERLRLLEGAAAEDLAQLSQRALAQ